jgi:3-methyladenine DNA glycosylase AlkD
VDVREALARLDGMGAPRLPDLRRLAKEAGKDHRLALALWRTRRHDARLLATLVDDPRRVTEAQMDRWVRDLDAWDVCDACAMNLFDRTTLAWRKATEWAGREEEFVKRCGFATMAALAVHQKDAADARFATFLRLAEREADDPRKYVKKGASWALRQIGKRSPRLRVAAVATARRIRKRGTPAARWIASDALRELAR